MIIIWLYSGPNYHYIGPKTGLNPQPLNPNPTNLFDGEKVAVRLERARVREDRLGDAQHRRVGCAEHVVRVDDDGDARVVELGLGYHVVGRRHADHGDGVLAHGAVVGREELEHLTMLGEGRVEGACM